MEITSFKDMYIAELQEMSDAEKQLTETLLCMASVASHGELKGALVQRREETQAQGDRLRSLLRKHGADPNVHTDQAMQALEHFHDGRLHDGRR
ncbi:MAG: DUF892 family protein [Beijerinckiaceae bacterium]